MSPGETVIKDDLIKTFGEDPEWHRRNSTGPSGSTDSQDSEILLRPF